jgi:ABC-type multidrug transport system permease subunit
MMEKEKRNHGPEKLLDTKKIVAIIQKNFIVLTRDRVRIIPLILFPVFMILVFGYTSGNIPKHIDTALISYDNSLMSEEIQQEISNSQVFAVRYRVSTEGEARKLLDKGRIRAIIEIPSGLERDIDDGVQTGVTVIVDESDSAVASTVKQTLNNIVNTVSMRISMQKLEGFQRSVGAAAQQLQAYAQQPQQYSEIYSMTAPAETYILEAKKVTDQKLKATIASALPPLMFSPTNKHVTLNESNIFMDVPMSYYATAAQIAVLQQTSQLLSAADKTVHAASEIAKISDSKAQSLQEYEQYTKKILTPVKAIRVFTRYSKNGILRPLVYKEKPAYGTGKRPIDFVIPSIIALTIFQGALMGMGRAIAGEKREGSLTRVFLTPTSNATIIIGTLLFYTIFEMFRSSFLICVSMLFFNIKIEGSLLSIGLVLFIYAGVSTAMGMIVSSIVKTEQQFISVAMLFSMPTMFLSGALFPVQAMPKAMQVLAQFLPVTYAGDALRGLMIKGFSIGLVAFPIFILLVFLTMVVSIVFMVFTRDIE